MPTSYTSLLNLALPVTGELSGTWGDTVNDYITKYVDSSVAGTQTISGTQTAVTLTRASGASLSPVGSGSTGSSQYAIINCTGSPASTLTITVDVSTGSPTLSNSTYSQTFAVINATSTSQSVVVRATTTSGTSTGVTMVSGERALIAWSGSDFTKIATSVADGVTTFSAGTTGFTPSSATSGAVTLAGTLATTNGGTGLTSFTANRVFYASSTSAIAQSANLTFDGTTLTVNNLTDSSLTSGRVIYAGTGGNLTDSANLTFDGTTFTHTGASNFATSTGSLFVGTTSAAAGKLAVKDTASSNTLWLIGRTSDGASSISFRNAADSAYNARLEAVSGQLAFEVNGSEQMRLTTTGLGIGTNAPGTKLVAVQTLQGNDVTTGAELLMTTSTATNDRLNLNFSMNGIQARARAAIGAIALDATGGYNCGLAFYTRNANDGTALATTDERMRIDSAGNVGIGATSPSASLEVQRASAASSFGIRHTASGNGYGYRFATSGTTTNDLTISSEFNGSLTTRATITAAGFTRPVAYADTVSALGNTGTATTINLQNANVFTATLTGNCTFTLSNPIATGSSSFTLILTNDGTAGRTVAWAGGAFRFPGGAASLSRTTTANAVDIWVFFTPDGGTTWYGNIAMKNMAA